MERRGWEWFGLQHLEACRQTGKEDGGGPAAQSRVKAIGVHEGDGSYEVKLGEEDRGKGRHPGTCELGA